MCRQSLNCRGTWAERQVLNQKLFLTFLVSWGGGTTGWKIKTYVGKIISQWEDKILGLSLRLELGACNLFKTLVSARYRASLGFWTNMWGNKCTSVPAGLFLGFSKLFSILFYFLSNSLCKKQKPKTGNNRSQSALIPGRASFSVYDLYKTRSECTGQFLGFTSKCVCA